MKTTNRPISIVDEESKVVGRLSYFELISLITLAGLAVYGSYSLGQK